MRYFYLNLTIIIALVLFSASNAEVSTHDQSQEITRKVHASGIGTDTEKAKSNAIRNAIEQTVGVYVSSDVVAQNSKIIKDEILRYSGGFVKEVNVLSQGVNDDGLKQVEIEALVVGGKLQRSLQNLNIATLPISGTSLAEQLRQKQLEEARNQEDQQAVMEKEKSQREAQNLMNQNKEEMQKNRSALLEKLFEKIPVPALRGELVGQPVIGEVKGNQTSISVTARLTWYQNFVKEMREVVDKIADGKKKYVTYRKSIDGSKDNYEYLHLGALSFCFTNKTLNEKDTAEACYSMTEKYNKVYSKIFSSFKTNDKLVLVMKDNDGDILETSNHDINVLAEYVKCGNYGLFNYNDMLAYFTKINDYKTYNDFIGQFSERYYNSLTDDETNSIMVRYNVSINNCVFIIDKDLNNDIKLEIFVSTEAVKHIRKAELILQKADSKQ